MSWGDHDFPHLITQAERMTVALGDAKASVETLVLENCDHLGASYACGETSAPWVRALDQWSRDCQI